MMTRVVFTALAAVLISTSAMARQRTADVVPNNRSCFDVDYVPALYAVNSRGKLVRREGMDRTFAIVEQVGGSAVYTRKPAVYMETRKLLEPDHYTMRPAACR